MKKTKTELDGAVVTFHNSSVDFYPLASWQISYVGTMVGYPSALAVNCPRCGVSAFHLCQMPSGRKYESCHMARWHAFENEKRARIKKGGDDL